MFDKTFFRFAIGFMVIILFSMGTLYIAGYFDRGGGDTQTAAVR